ncbi:MAG: phosphatidate cytidylyltransferase [Thermoanaerobaculia bacterium]|nr:phosphatidate cytidylyltransferase [Thermoanaerobaculia bacterium]
MASDKNSPDTAARARKSHRQKRLLTGLIGAPVALALVFFLPPLAFFGLILAVFTLAAFEYVRLARHWAPSAPLASLLAWVPLAACALFWPLDRGLETESLGMWLVVAGAVVAVGPACTVLFARSVREPEAFIGIGVLAFGIPYFALPTVCVARLQGLDPWLLFLLLAIVWLGDTAAFYVGSRIGRHKMAPKVSPNKSWEGAVAGFAAGLGATAVWSWWRLGEIPAGLLAVAALTAIAAQIGDLVESVIKRGAGVKDSSDLLPGHGGIFDRMDAMLLAAPVFLLGLWVLGLGPVVR